MKIYSSNDLKRLEAHTIDVLDIDDSTLMDKAIDKFCTWFIEKLKDTTRKILVIAGPGNNGGDAVGIAGILNRRGYEVTLLHVDLNVPFSELNRKQLKKYEKELFSTRWKAGDPLIHGRNIDCIIDGLFGYGLSRPLDGDLLTFVKYLNGLSVPIYAIDIPSGIYADMRSSGPSIEADYTLSFHSPKASFFLAENADAIGEWEIADIGLVERGFKPEDDYVRYLTLESAARLYPRRSKFAHKGTFGHNLIIAGHRGMAGAALLTAKACLKSGAGKLTIHAPSGIYTILQSGLPEAMISEDCNRDSVAELPDLSPYTAIGVGPGMGNGQKAVDFLKALFAEAVVPLIIDADALNIMSQWDNWESYLKADDIILPHPGEFDRLFGTHNSQLDRIQTIEKVQKEYDFTIVLKGAHTEIAQAGRTRTFNATGNPGMGTAGSGDVLTGIVTSFVGQGIESFDAATLAVYIHGLAGDIYVEKSDMASLIAGDIIDNLGKAIRIIEQKK